MTQPRTAAPIVIDAIRRFEAGEPLAGEDRSGDLAVWVPYEGGALVAVIDGLGHGGPAADASEAAAEQFHRYAGEPPEPRGDREVRTGPHARVAEAAVGDDAGARE